MFRCDLKVCSISSRAILDITRSLCLSIPAIFATSIFLHRGIALFQRSHEAFHYIFISFISRHCIIPTFGLSSIGRCLFCSFRMIHLGLVSSLAFRVIYDCSKVIGASFHFIGSVDYFMSGFFQGLDGISFGFVLTYCS